MILEFWSTITARKLRKPRNSRCTTCSDI